MKRIFSFIMAVVLVTCALFTQSAWTSFAREDAYGVCAGADDGAADCPCVCHTFYSLRDTILQSILDKSVDCKTLLRAVSYIVRLYTWRVLNVNQYCACGSRHY